MKHLRLGLGILVGAGAVAALALAAGPPGDGGSMAAPTTTDPAARRPPSTTVTIPRRPPAGPLGVFVGTEQLDEVAAFERWLGRPVGWVLDYVGRGRGGGPEAWVGIDDPRDRCAAWVNQHRQVVLSVAMLPSESHSLRRGARGDYDHHWRRFGERLVGGGCGDWVLRVGWEFNGRFYPWAAGGREDEFVAYWRRIVDVLRSVDGQQFRFDWTALAGNANADVEAAYPGDDYVDIIGLDAYDTSTVTDPEDRWKDLVERPYGLQWHVDFAARHGKPVAFPEWGVTVRKGDDLGGGDSALYTQRMLDWVEAHDPIYAIYFDFDAVDAAHKLSSGQFPEAGAVLRRWAATVDGD